MKTVCVILGGGSGAYLRYLLHQWIPAKPGAIPWVTLAVNLSGALAIGFLMTAFADYFNAHPESRLFFVVGLLGGYTTFSALAWESYGLFTQGHWAAGSIYVLVSALGGATAVIVGAFLGRTV